MTPSLTDLSDVEILQMQWDILEQLKQQRASNEAPVVLDAPLVEEKQDSLLSRLEEHFGGKATIPKKQEAPKKTGSPKNRRRRNKSRPHEVILDGLELYASQCELYTKRPYYLGGGGEL